MQNIPSVSWEAIVAKKLSNDDLYTEIIHLLTTDCLGLDVMECIEPLKLALPILNKKLHSIELSTLRLEKLRSAKETAKIVGYTKIHDMKRQEEQSLVFECAFIGLLACQRDLAPLKYPTIDSLLADYPMFAKDPECDKSELIKLKGFANFMNFSLLLMPSKGKKSHLLDLVTKISEGKYTTYCTGGAPKKNTIRRIKIYERESGTLPVPRPPRSLDKNNEVTDKSIKYIPKSDKDDFIPKIHWPAIVEILVDEDANYVADTNDNLCDEFCPMDRGISAFGDDIDLLLENAIGERNSKNIEELSCPLYGNYFIETTERTSPRGDTLVRAVSISKRKTDITGKFESSHEVLRSVSFSQSTYNPTIDTTKRKREDENISSLSRSNSISLSDAIAFWNEEELAHVEFNLPPGITVSRSLTTDINNNKIKGFSLVNQMSDDVEYKNFWNDENSFSELIRGGSMVRQLSGGQSNLVRGLSRGMSGGLSRHNSNIQDPYVVFHKPKVSELHSNAIITDGNEDPFFDELTSGSGFIPKFVKK